MARFLAVTERRDSFETERRQRVWYIHYTATSTYLDYLKHQTHPPPDAAKVELKSSC